jgi:aspartyl-tRNA(Asn)/glutamyl-tRNA(Gln) amidotransferase subunit B
VTDDAYELVIGLEVHAQLLTRSKLFSPMPAAFGAEPNTQVNEICAGLPGALPVLNGQAVAYAVRAGLALGCDIQLESQFARKNYFYPDLPKGYQISQYERPLCLGGQLRFVCDGTERGCGITRVHLEEDAGKSIHVPGAAISHVDLNRAGVPLIEIVSEPDLRTPDEAVAYLKELRNVLMYLEVCDGNMEEGSLRCDANCSVRRRGDSRLGVKVEIKNMNSFKFLKDALSHELERQVTCLETGQPIHQETRLWRTEARRTVAMRRKEGSDDYRYFPDPDLPPLVLERAWVEEIRRDLPVLPQARRQRYVGEWGLPAYDADVLTASRAVADYFEAAVAARGTPKAVSNWLMTEVLAAVHGDAELAAFPVTPAYLAELVGLIESGTLSSTLAKEVFAAVRETGRAPAAIVEERGLAVVRDEAALEAVIDEVLAAHPQEVADYRAGKTKLKGYFVGQVMRAMQGQAAPDLVQRLLQEKLA